jgi:hypothetical protein
MFKKYSVFESGTLVTETTLQSYNAHGSNVIFFFNYVQGV